MRRTKGKCGKIKEMIVPCTPRSERLAMALAACVENAAHAARFEAPREAAHMSINTAGLSQ